MYNHFSKVLITLLAMALLIMFLSCPSAPGSSGGSGTGTSASSTGTSSSSGTASSNPFLAQVGIIVQAEAILPDGEYTNTLTLAFTNGFAYTFYGNYNFYYNSNTYQITASNTNTSTLIYTGPAFHSDSGTKFYMFGTYKRLSGSNGSLVGSYEADNNYGVIDILDNGVIPSYHGYTNIWYVTNTNGRDLCILSTNNIIIDTFPIYWLRISNDEYLYRGEPYIKK